MQLNIRQVNETIYNFLKEKNENDRDLKYTLRRSNRAGKLEQGYWFYGNDTYLAVSFWTGMDFKNKTPNIYFGILNDGRTYLEIAVSDSQLKRKFIDDIFIKEYENKLQLKPSGPRYIKYYNPNIDYLSSLSRFLELDKNEIDLMIDVNKYFFDNHESDRIAFIESKDFKDVIQKVENYRINFSERQVSTKQELQGINISNYGPIKHTGFIKIPANTQWVFLIGENGTGKTSILRAIASGLCHRRVEDDSFFIELIIKEQNVETRSFIRNGNQSISRRKPLVIGFCSYGAARLKTSTQYKLGFSLNKSLNKEGLTKSLFDLDTVLIDIQEQLMVWNRNPTLTELVKKRTEYIKEVLVDLLPRVVNINFDQQTWRTTYIEKDENENHLEPVTYDKLASGTKSLVAMIGDIMMRLFNQQTETTDPSELTGIVLIDEIDIHLHPKAQKTLIEQLTITFPKIQFFASTHSPIPLLGAPENALIFRIDRNHEEGVVLTDLTEINIQTLLPNSLLTSDLFGMNSLFKRKKTEEIRTEDFYSELLKNDLIIDELKKIAFRLKNN